MTFCLGRLQGIITLQSAVSVVGGGITVEGLVLGYDPLQNIYKSNCSGRVRLPPPGTVSLSSCREDPGNCLNRIHDEIRNSVFCVDPSLAAYFNSVLWLFVYYIGINPAKFTVNLRFDRNVSVFCFYTLLRRHRFLRHMSSHL